MAADTPETEPALRVEIASSPDDLQGVPEMMREYLEWDLGEFKHVSGVQLDVDEYVSNTLNNLGDYMPPKGAFALARDGGDNLRGFVLLKSMDSETAEIKRLFVDPSTRGAGLGRKLVSRVLERAREIGYRSVLLDSASYMQAAHRLYRDFGFEDIEYYPGNETDASLSDHLVYMRLVL